MENTNQRTPHFKPVEELTFTDDFMLATLCVTKKSAKNFWNAF